jgi:hypothetical protein
MYSRKLGGNAYRSAGTAVSADHIFAEVFSGAVLVMGKNKVKTETVSLISTSADFHRRLKRYARNIKFGRYDR